MSQLFYCLGISDDPDDRDPSQAGRAAGSWYAPGSGIQFLAVISVPFVLDAIQSVRAALDLGRALEAMTKAKAELEDLQVQIALLRAEASVRAANFRGDVRDWAGELRTDAKVWASDLKETALERASAIREEAVTFREEIREQIAPADGPELTALLKRLDALKEKHLHLSRHMGFYRKGFTGQSKRKFPAF